MYLKQTDEISQFIYKYIMFHGTQDWKILQQKTLNSNILVIKINPFMHRKSYENALHVNVRIAYIMKIMRAAYNLE